jgi:hypothetical protein
MRFLRQSKANKKENVMQVQKLNGKVVIVVGREPHQVTVDGAKVEGSKFLGFLVGARLTYMIGANLNAGCFMGNHRNVKHKLLNEQQFTLLTSK